MKFNNKTIKHSNGINLATSKTIIVIHIIVLEKGCTKLLQREQHRIDLQLHEKIGKSLGEKC
jgi:hypothetical protein